MRSINSSIVLNVRPSDELRMKPVVQIFRNGENSRRLPMSPMIELRRDADTSDVLSEVRAVTSQPEKTWLDERAVGPFEA